MLHITDMKSKFLNMKITVCWCVMFYSLKYTNKLYDVTYQKAVKFIVTVQRTSNVIYVEHFQIRCKFSEM
jgi:hypothetical protein